MNETVNTTASVAADSALMKAHPRSLFGKWAKAGVPHTGWECVSVDDLGEPLLVCEMCEFREIRYVHCMRHPDYPEVLDVGCVCAGKMEADPEDAKRRERDMKNLARRRAKWLDRWKVSANGKEWRRTPGYRVIIRNLIQGWTFKVVRRADRYEYNAPERFSSSNEAKLAAFDFLCMVSRVM
jgi:hypothetical protein